VEASAMVLERTPHLVKGLGMSPSCCFCLSLPKRILDVYCFALQEVEALAMVLERTPYPASRLVAAFLFGKTHPNVWFCRKPQEAKA